jgi:hypothetical protein
VSVIESVNFDKTENVTIYNVLPFGSVKIAGEWIKFSENSVSNQVFFKNKDNVELAISIHPSGKIEFNSKDEFKGFDFVKAL